jgi:hypothetical protein
MCLRCAGLSDAAVADHYARMIDEHGWAAVGVAAEVPWTYTVGLRWRLDHPELIVIGVDPIDAHHLLRDVVERIENGEALSAGTLVVLPDVEVTFGHVHHRNLVGEWFAQWHAVARACGQGTTSLRALHVRVDQLDDCDVCFDRQRALERPCSVDSLAAICHSGSPS